MKKSATTTRIIVESKKPGIATSDVTLGGTSDATGDAIISGNITLNLGITGTGDVPTGIKSPIRQ